MFYRGCIHINQFSLLFGSQGEMQTKVIQKIHNVKTNVNFTSFTNSYLNSLKSYFFMFSIVNQQMNNNKNFLFILD